MLQNCAFLSDSSIPTPTESTACAPKLVGAFGNRAVGAATHTEDNG
jgi:hypothetical protein